jgi:hypothetical protein
MRFAGLLASAVLLLVGCTQLNEPALQCTGTTPKYCPALGDAPEACWSAAADCAAVTACGPNGTNEATCDAKNGAASANEYVDCAMMICISTTTCAGNLANAVNDCQRCYVHKCCAELAACNLDATCDSTNNDATYQAALACGAAYCASECS